jgi:hypothetical protein
MSAAVDGTGATFKVGAVTPLFAPPLRNTSIRFYDVSPDGQRFLINATNEDRAASLMTIVVNWPAALQPR